MTNESKNVEELAAVIRSMSIEERESYRQELFNELTITEDNGILSYYEDGKDLLKDYSYDLNNDEFPLHIERRTTDGIVKEDLIEAGFKTISTSEGYIVYVNGDSNYLEIVDFEAGSYVIIGLNNSVAKSQRRVSLANMWEAAIAKLDECNNNLVKAQTIAIDAITEIAEFFGQKITSLTNTANAMRAMAKVDREMGLLEGSGELLENARNLEKQALELENQAAKYQKFTVNARTAGMAIVGKVVQLLGSTASLAIDVKNWWALHKKIESKIPCEGNESYAEQLNGDVTYYGSLVCVGDVATLAGAVFSVYSAAMGLAGTPLTGGLSTVIGGGLGLVGAGVSIVAGIGFDLLSKHHYNRLKSAVDKLKCDNDPCKDKPCPDGDGGGGSGSGGGNGGSGNGGNGGGGHGSGSTNDNPEIDPSGFVYEAIPENRVEGVQATIYYKEIVEDMYGDLSENIVLWDAEEYAQKNPLFTDENGFYRWDVPQGLWQVKFEKDGYVTTQSEWLPVPPPQLEVNIPIVQNKQPEVVDAHAYETGIQITFDKYMDKQTVNAKNVYLTVGGKKAAGEVVVIEEEGAEDNKYATTFRFVPEERLSMSQGEIRLTVSREVKSYAGIPMTSNYSQVFDIEKEITDITTNDNGQLLYGGEKTITVDVIPFDASVGKKLKVKNSSPSIMSVESDEIEIDENGQAQVKLTGELPGQAMLTFSVDDSYAKGEAIINVVTELYTVDMPIASRASGTEVYRGTKISLSTETPNATIYYTTDGSCPCDENGTRKKFILPIEITEDMDIKAMVETSNNEASEVAEFHYSLKKSDLDYTMAEGWTWISHNLESSVSPETIGALEPVQRIVGQTAEIVRDPQFGLVGNLMELSPEQSYKVETSSATENLRLTDVARNPSTPINVVTGWNWLGYTPGQTMSVAEAFSTTEVVENDYIVGQRGFAQYNGTEWEGTLETLVPGTGYLFNSQNDKQVVYNANIVSQAAAANARLFSSASPWAVDVNKYPQIMCMVVTIQDENGNDLSAKNYHFGAFSDSECRGIAKVVNGKYMMSVCGKAGDKIDFKLVPVDGENEMTISETIDFAETMIGNVNQPYMMKLNGEANSIHSVKNNTGWKITSKGHTLYLSGGDVSNISNLAVINLDGVKVFETSSVKNGEVRFTFMPSGIYIVAIVENGKYSYHKIVIK